MATDKAFADDTKVIIVNGTANHCLPYPSCYKPFEVTISPGDTVTWTNQDNRTHTATTGTSNYGPQAVFDSGQILPGKSYTQFFGTIGKYTYYDQVDMWPSGVVIVSNKGPSHAELAWVNGSLSINAPNTQNVMISKQIQNTGGLDANSIIFRLKIYNQTGFLFFDNFTRANVLPKQSTPISFEWSRPLPGNYTLRFDAENVIGNTNENNDVSSDVVLVSTDGTSQTHYLVMGNSVQSSPHIVPEFGAVSYLVLTISLMCILLISVKSHLRIGV